MTEQVKKEMELKNQERDKVARLQANLKKLTVSHSAASAAANAAAAAAVASGGPGGHPSSSSPVPPPVAASPALKNKSMRR